MDLKQKKVAKIEELVTKDHTFKPSTYSKNDKASKYYERQLRKKLG